MTLLYSKQTKITLDHLAALYEVMLDNRDNENAKKMIDLYNKLTNDEYIISFTGHFSAGKSSMINSILNEDVLPKSPIPTSGNIVEITSELGLARIYFNNNSVKTYKQPYNIDIIKEYCKDNKNVKKVELSTENNILPEGCKIIDTPGIDAADDGDRIITESSLHLADKLIYIMDYNHVQSEVNLSFLTEIQKRGMPFIIVINQIDKHDSREMSFNCYKEVVKQTFDQWGLEPDTVHFTSLFDINSRYNTLSDLNKELFQLLTTDKDITPTIVQSMYLIIEEHKNFLKEITNSEIEKITLSKLSNIKPGDLEKIKKDLNSVRNKPVEIESKFKKLLNETLNNAYLMPATLRDSAALFLESRKSNFKVGFFASKNKRFQEQERRLDHFLKKIQKSIESTIQWRLRDKLIALFNEYDLMNSNLSHYTQRFSIDYDKEDLLEIIKPGAKLSGNYVLNFTEDVSLDIKKKYKIEARKLFINIYKEVEEKFDKDIGVLEKKTSDLQNIVHSENRKKLLEKELTGTINHLEEQIIRPRPTNKVWDKIKEANTINELKNDLKHRTPTLIEEEKPLKEPNNKTTEESRTHQSIDHIVSSIDETIEAIETFPGFQTIITQLNSKKEKLTSRSLTIALFGAFSAGKSSFANALLGKGILPSSPNPTTAVINRISPPTEENKHKTVTIRLKKERSLINDILLITKELTPPDTDLKGLMTWLKESNIENSDVLDKMHQAYLHALLTGYDADFYKHDKTIVIKLEEFISFVTDEKKAAFIESITLYYDSPLTRLGISLVDTPGADSVNARHTDVAFDYIKQADAILYVTYYNHALSRADKNFLLQLGRVKDTFELDKMFFIINAADLAESDNDLDLVVNYVEKELNQLGIRTPRIFPVSSKNSLTNKLNNNLLNKQMQSFEQSFYHFVNHELAALSIKSTVWDMRRAHKSVLSYIENVNLSVGEKTQYKNSLDRTRQDLLAETSKIDATIYEERITQRIERQLHFVEERVSIRFHDLFKDYFNPATISNDGEKINHQLIKNLRRLLDETGSELLQELRAVSLRMESFIGRLNKETYEEVKERFRETDEQFMLPMLDKNKLTIPRYSVPFANTEIMQFNKALSHFKGLKAFFKKNEKNIMRDELYSTLSPEIKKFLNQNQLIMTDSYHNQWNNIIKDNIQRFKMDINHYIDDHLAMTGDQIDIEILKEKELILSKIVERSKEGDI